MINRNIDKSDTNLEELWVEMKDKVETKCFFEIKRLCNDYDHENKEIFLCFH